MRVYALIETLKGVKNQNLEVILEVKDQPNTSYGIDEVAVVFDSFLVLRSETPSRQ